MLLKVGELARHTGLTVRTLHHYDEIGLLKPSGRSDSGYRLYSRDDVARLHAIQALRHLGLALGDIAGLLDGEGTTPALIIDQQMHALDQEIARATELRARLALMRDGLVMGTQPDMSDWLDTLGLMTTFGKYFSAAELKLIFSRWKSIQAEWVPLVVQVRDAMNRGVPFDSPEVQPLASRWMSLMVYWMGGDFDLLERWGAMYKNEPSAHGRYHAPDSDMIAYTQRIIDLRRALMDKYLGMDDLRHLGWVPLADWRALDAQVTALIHDKVPAGSPPALAAVRQWSELIDRLTSHDAAARAKLLAAWAAEPLLAAGSALSAPVRAYLRESSK